jgi:predicted dehydrogenase
MKQKIRWGILGLGKIAHKFAQDLQLSKHAELYAVASRNVEKAQTFATHYQVKHAYDSYESLLKDPQVDVVYIATPHSLHKELTLMCFEHGKHVLCEKPMALDAADVHEMIQEARKRRLFLMEGIWTRFIPATQTYLNLIETGAIGEIRSIRADFGFQSTFDESHRIHAKSLGGGSLMDVGMYPVYLSLITLGKPKTIQATARISNTDVDASCYMLFNYEQGSVAQLDSSIEMETPTEAWIYGSKGKIYLHPRFHHTQHITVFKDGLQETLHIPYLGNGYVHEIDEVNACLLSGKIESDLLPLSTSLDLAHILDTVKSKIQLSYTKD